MNKLLKVSIVFLLALVIFLLGNSVEAAYVSSVESIDESRYPNIKAQLLELKKTYPNIQVLYTGLDWNKVIENEHSETHGRNLVSRDMDDAWICQDCKNQGIWYDSGLYCASEEAVEYMMDPRNFLNTHDIFQFQKLDASIGTTADEIRNVLKMEKVLYLQDDEAAIQAFANTAARNNLNAYHLVSRVIQEQGRSGTSTLSSGLGYTGNGYEYYGYGYYNLFSIGASRGSGEPSYMIYIHALDRAAIEGWNTRAASIEGGGAFVGENYIDVGQNTLYLQKFSVYNTNGQLYWHQYMQNLFGAQSEADILYNLYKINGIQGNSTFQFLVPLYENMPSQPSRMPGEPYDGYVNSYQYGDITTDGRNIKGQLVVQEWLNGTEQMEPNMDPIIVLKSDDGETIECNVEYVEPYVYQYSVDIEALNPLKEYYIEVRCANTNNISNHKVVTRIPCKNQELGKIYGYNTYMINNVFTFTYDGYMVSMPFTDLIVNNTRIEGQLIVQEWIDGTRQERPKTTPRVRLVAEDGSIIECEVGFIEPYVYGFSCEERYIDKTKKYELQVQSSTNKNISENKTVTVAYSNRNVGQIGNYTVKIEDNKIAFVYDGYMTSSQYSNVTLNGTTISGQLIVQEWLNGTKQIEPTTLPKLVIKNSEGLEVKEVTMNYVQPYVYSYSIDISDLNNGEYTYEVQGTNPNNISNHKNVVVTLINQEIGTIGNDEIKVESGKLVIEEVNNNYDGYMTSSQYTNVTLNGSMISGQLVVQEWLNGTKQIQPTTLPKLVIKNSSDIEVKEVTMQYVEPYVYSYSININDLGVGEYTYEVQGTNPNNISNHQKVEITLNSQEIGTIGNNEVKVESGKLVIEEVNNSYDGYMTSSQYTDVTLSGSTISGQLVVQEWLNGTKQIRPETLPKLVIKNSEGTSVKEVIMEYVEPYVYSYNVDISVLGNGKYTYEVQGTNPNNISNHQKVEVILNNQEIGQIGNNKVKVESGKLVIEEINNKYDGYMTSSQYTDVMLNGSTISGQLVVQEWLNGTKQIRPETLPKLVIKNSNGIEVEEVTMEYVEPYVYSYSIDISDLGNGEYTYEVQGTNPNNISNHQDIEIILTSQKIGTMGEYKLLTSNGKLVLEKEEKRTVIVQKNAEENEVINKNIEEDKKQQIEEKIESQNLETNELTNNSETNMVTDLEKTE